jgi:hypothetical protein
MQPRPEQLVEYVLGEADEAARSRLERAIAGSPALAARVQEIRDLIHLLATDDSVEPSQALMAQVTAMLGRAPREHLLAAVADRIAGAVRAVAQLVYDSRAQPALAGFRGPSSVPGRPHQLTYRAGDATVDLSLARQGDGWEVRGQVSGPTRETATPIALVPSGTTRMTASTAADDRGYFRLEVDRGVYDLLIGSGLIVHGITLGDH